MLCYFDSDSEVNLSYIDQVKTVRTLEELKARLSESGVTYVTSKEYSQPGLYPIEVSKVPSLWCAKTHAASSNILLNLPSKVVKAVKLKKLRILIISTIEGDNFSSTEFNGFQHLNDSIKLLGLPKSSVLIISGNLNASKQYAEWCSNNNEQELIEFQEGIEWDGKTSTVPESPVVIKDYSASFNSLNRAHRNHRTEHLYFLAENKLTGLVSGGAWFATNSIDPPVYQTVEYNHYKTVLTANYPKTLDVQDLVNQVPNLVNNLEIYENSQLTVVTESHFNQTGGLFITEKTFRPLLVGHPFMILGQKGTLAKLRSWGFSTDFDGIDQSYDLIEDDCERFSQFHRSLRAWCVQDPEIRRTAIYKWDSIIQHNFQNYKKSNFKKTMFDNAILSTEQYFKKCF
jgi:hypothetical protein